MMNPAAPSIAHLAWINSNAWYLRQIIKHKHELKKLSISVNTEISNFLSAHTWQSPLASC